MSDPNHWTSWYEIDAESVPEACCKIPTREFLDQLIEHMESEIKNPGETSAREVFTLEMSPEQVTEWKKRFGEREHH